MALRRDYSLSKDMDIEANAEMIDCMTENYESYLIPGQHFKSLLKRHVAIYKGSCGEGEDINQIYDLYTMYANMNITDEDFSFNSESSLVKHLFDLMGDYEKELAYVNEELGRVIDGWLGTVTPSVVSPEQKRRDMNYVGQVEQILNRRLFLYETRVFLYLFMKGALSEGFPEEPSDMESLCTSLELPLMTHIPFYADIDETELGINPVMQVLYNMVIKDSYFPMRMMHDYDNGNACVMLWKKEDDKFVPLYVSVKKSEVFVEKVSYAGQRAIWPGLIEEALRQIGCVDSKEGMALAILGPELEKSDIDFICNNKSGPTNDSASESFNNAIEAYIKCIYDTYASFLGTNSLLVPDDLEYRKLTFGLKEFMYALSCCYNQTFDIVNPAKDLIKKYIKEYRQYAAEKNLPTEQIVKKRLSVCNTIDEVIKLLESDSDFRYRPHLYFEKFLAERIARTVLNSMHKEINTKSLNEKTREIMLDSVFRRTASKLNIHVLRYASNNIAESVIAKMERR